MSKLEKKNWAKKQNKTKNAISNKAHAHNKSTNYPRVKLPTRKYDRTGNKHKQNT